MPTAEEIKERLLDENSGLRESIVRDIGTSTVALFAIIDSSAGELLRFCGTGSLVQFANSHCILTTAHVWEECLKHSQRVGITLKENVDHRCPIDTAALVRFGLPVPQHWNEWGPDLMFLRIPHNLVGGIEAFKRFYPLDRELPKEKGDRIEVSILMGAPGEFGKYTPTHAELNINGFFSDVNAGPYKHGEFDYVDLKEDMTFPGIPKDFGGVSGGGLWRVQVFGTPDDAEIKRRWSLEGVAFFQIPVANSQMVLRCHGPESIHIAMKMVPEV